MRRAAHEFSAAEVGGARDVNRFRRDIWLLDKLAPKGAVDIFESLMADGRVLASGDDRLLLAWGRRLEGGQRDRILEVAASGLGWMQLQAAAIAWCESCPEPEIASLLRWDEKWRPVFKDASQVVFVASHPEAELYRRCLDRHVRRQCFKAQLDCILSDQGEGDEIGREVAAHGGRYILGSLLKDAAPDSESPDAAPPRDHEWHAWLERKLAEPAFSWVGPRERELL